MRLCDKCFSVLEHDAMFCPDCGAASAGEGSDALVYADIARANLLRMRGSLEEAESVCLGILKRFPNNASAHALLGDIHNDRGSYTEARQWYEMALDFVPNDAPVQKKLARVCREIERDEVARGSSGLEVGPAGKGVATMYAVVVVLLLAVGGFAFWLGGERVNRLRDKRADVIEPISINGVPPPAPANVEPKPPAPPPSGAATNRAMTDEESALLSELAAAAGDAGARVLSVQIDPRDATATVTVAGSQSAENDILLAAKLGEALLKREASRRLLSVDVRVLEPSGGKLRMMGSVSAESLRAASGEPGTPDWARSAVGSVYLGP